jgi:hypothetical protein
MLPRAGFGRRMKGAAGRAGILSAILLAHGLLVAALLMKMEVALSPAPERITYLVLPTAPARPPPPDAPSAPIPQDHDATPAAALHPVTARPAVRHRKTPPATSTAVLRDDRRDPCGRPLRPDEKPQPGIACDDDAQRAPSLALPGSLHLDERGALVPDQKDLFAMLPPASTAQAAADADRHFAALRQTFPKWEPHTMELWKSPPMDFCGCSIALVGTNLVLEK